MCKCLYVGFLDSSHAWNRVSCSQIILLLFEELFHFEICFFKLIIPTLCICLSSRVVIQMQAILPCVLPSQEGSALRRY